MKGLILCSDRTVRNPYLIPGLGISIHSAEELSYYIYNYLFLLDNDFINEQLLYFIGTELGLPKLEVKIRRWATDRSDLTQILYMMLQDLHYYSESELAAFKGQLEWLRRADPAERMKKRADYLLSQHKYAAAVSMYDQILMSMKDSASLPEFCGAVVHNKGMAYAGLFRGEAAAVCLKEAYELLQDSSILKEWYQFERLQGGKLSEELQEAIPAELKAVWNEEFDALYLHCAAKGISKEIDELWEKDSIKRNAGVGEILSYWKAEYREMAKA